MNRRAQKIIPWDSEIVNIKRMHGEGRSGKEIAAHYGIYHSSLSRALIKRGIYLSKSRKPLTASEAREMDKDRAVKRQIYLLNKEAAKAKGLDRSTSGLLSFSALKKIDDLIGNGWSLPFAFEEVTGRTYAGGVR